MDFRPFETSDLEPVVAIFRSNIPKYFVSAEESGLREFLREYSADYLVGEMDGEVVAGGGIALNADGTVSLCWGMVRDELIGTGLGKKLTILRIERARERFGKLPLVISTSQHTQGFYEKLGFDLTQHTPNGFGPGIDECKMRKEL
ncbi:MAG: GNAT family N-acetyltransferase [Pyrinomonadaceae bacterium]